MLAVLTILAALRAVSRVYTMLVILAVRLSISSSRSLVPQLFLQYICEKLFHTE